MADTYSNMIRDRVTGTVYTQQGWLALYPDVSFSFPLTVETLNDFGADAVMDGPQAVSTDIYHYSQYNGVVEQDGVWYTSYVLGPTGLSPEEWDAWVLQVDDQQKAANKAQAQTLLTETDWADIPAVSDPANIPHLANKDAFNTYRLALRAIAVTPPVTVSEWPTKPEEIWVTE